LREARAYNNSTLFMVGVPYALLAGCGLAVYVLYRKKLKLQEAAHEMNESDLSSVLAQE
jgi:hypothetical protein